jgi:hypothetical protein
MNTSIPGIVANAPFNPLETYTPASGEIFPINFGALGVAEDGRKFKLGYNASTSLTLAAGKLCQGPAISSTMQAVTLSAQSIGDTQVTITFSAGTAYTANQFSGGYLVIISGTGSPQMLQILSNQAITSSATTAVLKLADPFVVATTGTVTANVIANPYSAVVVCPTTLTGTVAGIPLVAIAPSTLGWFQVSGVSIALNQGGTTAGLGLAPSASVAGALATVGATTQEVADAEQTGVDGAYSAVKLVIA